MKYLKIKKYFKVFLFSTENNIICRQKQEGFEIKASNYNIYIGNKR